MTTTIYTDKPKRISNKRKTTKEFIKDAIDTHGKKYDYSKVEYTNSHIKIEIICKEHGSFFQKPYHHLNNGGCSKCSGKAKYDTKSIIEKFKEVHNKYDYRKVLYIGKHNNVDIICPEHGLFSQSPHSHTKGSGCPICAREKRGFGYYVSEDDIESNDICVLYKIRIYNDNEEFYKTGITKDLNDRHQRIISQTGYNIEVIDILIDTRRTCYLLEQKLLNKYRRKGIMYIPQINFDGRTECYII